MSTLYTRDLAIAEAIKMVNMTEQPESEKELDVKMPEKFKLTSKWIIVFAEAVDTYLNHLEGQGWVLLNYIIRTLEIPIPSTTYTTKQELIILMAPLIGALYDLDNKCVYGIIKLLILEGPVWVYITTDVDRTKNCRASWLALHTNPLRWYITKMSTQFTFEHFTGILTKAYNDLGHYGESY